MRSLYRLGPWLPAILFVAVPAPVRAAEADKYLPGDTQVVVTIHVKQILDSAIIKKQVLDWLQAQVKSNEEVHKVLTSLGLDPFTDIDRVILAAPGGGDNERGLFIVHGRFDPAKFRAGAEQAAKDNSDRFKILKVSDGANGKHTLYRLTLPGQQPLFAALIDKGPLVLSPGEEYVIGALNKAAGREKAELKSKPLRNLLERADPKQSVTLAALGPAAAKILPNDAGPAKDLFNKIESITGGISFAETAKLEIVFTARDNGTAREVNQAITATLNETLAVLGLAADDQKQLAPLIEVLKSIKISTKDAVVSVRAELSADVLDKLVPKGK